MKRNSHVQSWVAAAVVLSPIAVCIVSAQAAACFESTDELRSAVDVVAAGGSTNYGSISTWCVSQIQDFSELFSAKRNADLSTFNKDISQWDVSRAMYMGDM
jgi:ethanolamine ammonia-lyase large subunit